MAILTIEDLSKDYGAVRALNKVSFAVPEKTVFGILGPNGSGKTTLLGIVMDILKVTSGSYSWTGHTDTDAMRKKIGTLLETPNFYHYLSGENNLRIAARIKGKGEADIPKVLKMVNLYERRDSKFNTYSLGMKQRLAIASTLLGDPEILVFDEPTNGLDPAGIAEIRELIKALNRQGKTIIMASHILDEVEKVCTHAAILKTGNLITTGNVEEIMMDEDIVEVSANDLNALATLINQSGKKITIDEKANTIQIVFPRGTAKMDEINRFCFDNGVVLTQLVLRKKRLETRFFELTNN